MNPSARLPFTVPVDEADLAPFDRDATTFTYDRWHGWWRAARDGIRPAYPFGFGLSYTTFQLVEASAAATAHSITVNGRLRNIGDRDGTDVVQVYAALPTPGAPQRLIGFARVDTTGGGEAGFQIDIPVARLATRDSTTRTWMPATGSHRISVARFAGDPDSVTVDLDL